MNSADEHGALEDLFWRDEILQVMYWLEGEQLTDTVDSEQLAQFLVADIPTVAREMSRLVEEGYLELVPGRQQHYRLTEVGRQEGGRRFQDEFAELTRPGHGECAPGCWCHDPKHAGEPCPSH